MSRACCTGLGEDGARGLRVGVELALGAGDVHLQPDEALLRTVVQVALQAAQRLVFRDDGGAARSGQVGDLALQRLGPPRPEHPGGDGLVHQREPARDERQGGREDDPEDQVQDDGRRRADRTSNCVLNSQSNDDPREHEVAPVLRDEAVPDPAVRPPSVIDTQTMVTVQEKMLTIGFTIMVCSR